MSKNTAIKSYKLKNNETSYIFRRNMSVESLPRKERTTTRAAVHTTADGQHALAELRAPVTNRNHESSVIATYEAIHSLWINHSSNTAQHSTFVKTLRIFKKHILPE